jgi:hypothetical protein
MRLRHTRIIREEEKKVGIKMKGFCKRKEMIRIYIPKTRKATASSTSRQKTNHQ